MTLHDDMTGVYECLYCGTGGHDPEAPVPPVGDDAAWADIAGGHLDSCEWVRTRAHRIEGPNNE